MAQQTAVEWLIKELEEQKLIKLDKLSTILFNKNFATRYELIIEQAKAMEKEQMVDATVQYLIKHRGMHSEQSILTAVELSEQYYNETYNK